jgi:hypothetical protein
MEITPRLTGHARTRCQELGISTKRAKRIVKNRSSTYPSPWGHDNNGLMVHSASDSEYGVVWDPDTNCILTVVPRIVEKYTRTKDGYTV